MFKSNLRHYRRMAGLTQQELGVKIGIRDPSNPKHGHGCSEISFYERGERVPGLKKSRELARVLSELAGIRVTIDDLFPPA